MQFTGKHVLEAAPYRIWENLMNIDTLVKVIPCVTSLQQVGENTYTSTFQFKFWPLNGSFSGNLELEDLSEPEKLTLKVQQNSRIGNASAAIKVELISLDGQQTLIAFDVEAKLSGLLASLGGRVIDKVARKVINKFFSNLERELLNENSDIAYVV
jgi:carbon monoxide dehydrogenase subunit G